MADYQQGQPITISDSFSLNGVPTDPTTLTYKILGPDGVLVTYTFPGDPEITNPAIGSYELALAPPSFPGLYQYDVDAIGAVVASRAGSFNVLPDRAQQTAQTWAKYGPCTLWADAQDVWNCCGQPTTTVGVGSDATECPVDMTLYADEASQVLWALSGRQFSGQCEKTVRPPSWVECGYQILSRGYVVNPWAWGYGTGYGWSWWPGNGWWHGSPDRVLLSGYRVREIVEVKIDGVVLNPSEYRLDERRYLTRLRDPLDPTTPVFWPSRQIRDLDDTQPDTWSVTYRYGDDPPPLGVAAAAQLGCELYNACSGVECKLPSGTVRVTRNGVTIDRTFFGRDPQSGTWRSGLNLVDAFLNSVNPAGLTRRPAVYSPDGPQYARTVGQ